MLNNIKEKIKHLSMNNPIFLLDTMNDDEIFLVQEILKEYENIQVFIIEKNNKKRIFIKLQVYSVDLECEENLEGKIHSLYSKKDYEITLKELLQIICNDKNPKPCYYKMLGYTYLNLKMIEKAIECFIIAEGVSKGTKNRYRFDSLIKKLENKKVAL